VKVAEYLIRYFSVIDYSVVPREKTSILVIKTRSNWLLTIFSFVTWLTSFLLTPFSFVVIRAFAGKTLSVT
jgi:hypothetical protein